MGDAHVAGLVVVALGMLVAVRVSGTVGIVPAIDHVGTVAVAELTLVVVPVLNTPPAPVAAGGAARDGLVLVRVDR